MNKAQILEFGTGPEFGNLEFPNLRIYLEESLAKIQTLPDLERLIKTMNPLLKNAKFNTDEHQELKRLRQRAYDRRRSSKFDGIALPDLPKNLEPQITAPKIQIPKSPNPKKLTLVQTPLFGNPTSPIILKNSDEPLTTTKEDIMKSCHEPHVSPLLTIAETSQGHRNESFLAGMHKALLKLDGEAFAQKAPKILGMGIATSVVSAFVWIQSVDLYKSAGFLNPELTAAGALLMILGFAAYHAMTRSFLALLLCLYAGGYEGYFMISGTIHDEKTSQVTMIERHPEMIFQKEKMEKNHSLYLSLKTRYEETGSDVYMNPWFKKKHLDPAWLEFENSQTALTKVKIKLEEEAKLNDVTWMKVFYRLGLVLLCMVMVHQMFRRKM